MQGQAFLGPQKAKQPRQYVFGARDRMDETYDCIRCLRDKRFKYIRNFMPYLTRGQNIAYMDQTPILQEMRRLHAAGKLKPGAQMQFFEPTKPVHELYDTAADPHEVHNLAADPKYRDVLERMSKDLIGFMKGIGDVGLIPEPDFDAMKGGGAAATPAFHPRKGLAPGHAVAVEITCPTRGASIAYQVVAAGAAQAAPDEAPAAAKRKARAKGARRGGGGRWLLYSKPVPLDPGQAIRAQAWRIGYKPSAIATYACGEKPAPAAAPAEPGPLWREKLNNTDLIERLLALKEYDGRWAEGTEAFLKALKDKDAPVRYWAVVGLHQGCKDAAAIAKAKAAVAPLLNDRSASVSVAAAQALVDWGEQPRGLARLVEVLQSGGDKGSLFAAWALWYLGEKANPVLAKLQPGGGRRGGGAVLQRTLARYRKST
jgi:hypothetical protein